MLSDKLSSLYLSQERKVSISGDLPIYVLLGSGNTAFIYPGVIVDLIRDLRLC